MKTTNNKNGRFKVSLGMCLEQIRATINSQAPQYLFLLKLLPSSRCGLYKRVNSINSSQFNFTMKSELSGFQPVFFDDTCFLYICLEESTLVLDVLPNLSGIFGDVGSSGTF